jgi:hypothetical protein
MNKYAQLQPWLEIIQTLEYPRQAEEIYKAVELNGNISFEDFKSECESFYKLYLNMIEYTKSHGISKQMTRMFNTVARILDLIGHEPELATEEEQRTLFDFLVESNDSSAVKVARMLTESEVEELTNKEELHEGMKIESEHKDTVQEMYENLGEQAPTPHELEEVYKDIALDHEKETIDATGEANYYKDYLIPMEKEMKKASIEQILNYKPEVVKYLNELTMLIVNYGLSSKEDLESYLPDLSKSIAKAKDFFVTEGVSWEDADDIIDLAIDQASNELQNSYPNFDFSKIEPVIETIKAANKRNIWSRYSSYEDFLQQSTPENKQELEKILKRMKQISNHMLVLEPDKREELQKELNALDQRRKELLDTSAVSSKLKEDAKPIWSGSYTDYTGWGWGASPKGGWDKESSMTKFWSKFSTFDEFMKEVNPENVQNLTSIIEEMNQITKDMYWADAETRSKLEQRMKELDSQRRQLTDASAVKERLQEEAKPIWSGSYMGGGGGGAADPVDDYKRLPDPKPSSIPESEKGKVINIPEGRKTFRANNEKEKRFGFVAHLKGHKDSEGNKAEWVIKDHETGKVLSSHSTEEAAKKHLQQMHAHKEASMNDYHIYFNDPNNPDGEIVFDIVDIKVSHWPNEPHETGEPAWNVDYQILGPDGQLADIQSFDATVYGLDQKEFEETVRNQEGDIMDTKLAMEEEDEDARKERDKFNYGRMKAFMRTKSASDPYLEEKLYNGTASYQELMNLKEQLEEDLQTVKMDTPSEYNIKEQLDIITQQLGNLQGGQSAMDDQYSFKGASMKLNSKTLVVTAETNAYKQLEDVVSKIAEANKIDNVKIASISLSKEKGIIEFKKAADTENILLQMEQELKRTIGYDFEDLAHEIMMAEQEGVDPHEAYQTIDEKITEGLSDFFDNMSNNMSLEDLYALAHSGIAKFVQYNK